MARLRYLDEESVELLISVASDLFPDTPAFIVREPEGRHLLESALAVPRLPYHRTLPHKAAALQYHLNLNHPFFDGNKRFAVAAMEAFIALNGAALLASDEKLVELGLAIARHEIDRVELSGIVQRRTVRLHWPEHKIDAWIHQLYEEDPSDMSTLAQALSAGASPAFHRIYSALKRQIDHHPRFSQ